MVFIAKYANYVTGSVLSPMTVASYFTINMKVHEYNIKFTVKIIAYYIT